jgi:probable HAF family extracellular repeat protein
MVRSSRHSLVFLSLPLTIAALLATRTVVVPAQAPAPTLYGVQPFGPDGASSGATDISELGSPIVGHVRSSSGADRAAVWSYGGYRELGTLGGASSVALGAYYGVIVGQSQTASGLFHAFKSDSGFSGTAPLVDLGTLGGSSSVAYATDSGSVVGSAQVAGDSRWQAFIWANGVMSALPVTSQGDSSANDVLFDQIVGHACAAGNASCVGFWIKEGTVMTLPTLGGSTTANAINGREQIVGVSAAASGGRHAFLYANGTITDLQTLGGTNSEALDLNDAGHVVGASDTAAGGPHAFLYRDGVMTDLNTLLPPGSGWVLQRATGISAGGQIVGAGTLDGQPRGFLLTPPTDVLVSRGGMRSQHDSNLPRGVEAGRTIQLVESVWATPDPLTVHGVKITATLTGPAEYQTVRIYDGDLREGSECQVAPKTITCDVPPIDTVGFGSEFWFTVRTTGPGNISHTVTASSAIPDPDPANNSVSEANYAVALTNLELTPPVLAGGKASSARVTLTGIPPQGDAVVRLASSRPDIAPVPATLIVPAHNNSAQRAFNIIPAVVPEPTPVEISATYGLVTVKRTLTVVPPVLTQLYLTPTTVIGGCGTSAGKIVLSGSAPGGGAVVSLTNSNSAAIAPSAVTVPAGASSQTFAIPTRTVTSNVNGTVTASYGGVAQTLAFTVRPIRVKTVTFSPNPAAGGATVAGTLTLECAAPASGVVVTLSSNNGAVAAPTVTAVAVPAGASSASFNVRTSPVATSTSVTIYATAYGVRKSTSLTVRP